MKTCKICNTEKPLTDFVTGKRYRDGHRPYCKDCFYTEKRKQYARDTGQGFPLKRGRRTQAPSEEKVKKIICDLDARKGSITELAVKHNVTRQYVSLVWHKQLLDRRAAKPGRQQGSRLTLTRRIAQIPLLLTKDTFTQSELAQIFSVDGKTIRRDISVLSEFYPIVTKKRGREVQYRIFTSKFDE